MAGWRSKAYIYVIDRDFGFAPNPFHGICTLACCKPRIRSTAQVNDWIFGVGGARLGATGRCIFGMRVGEVLSFDEYWADDRFHVKKPVRNGSRAMMLGDNIYHRDHAPADWQQLDSHHSNPDGTPDQSNIDTDTRTNRVLVSTYFCYFGVDAPEVPTAIFDRIGYSNGRNHRTFDLDEATELIDWFAQTSSGSVGMMVGDPFQFRESAARYSAGSNKIIKDEVTPFSLFG
jgi:hypothetical protein